MGTRTSLVIIALLCMATGICSADTERNTEKSFNVKHGGTLNLDSDYGTVEITSHADPSVMVNVVLIADTSNNRKAEEIFDDFELAFSNTDNDVTIKGEFVNDRFRRNSRLKVNFYITVPERYNIEVDTAAGGITVGDITGRINLETSGGRISLGNITGDIKARTSGGGIKLKDVTGNTFVKTSGGSIKVGKVKGDLEARTSGGRIDVDGVDGDLTANTSGGGLHLMNIHGRLTGETSGGPIAAVLSSQHMDRVELRTSGGGITLSVPSEFRADLDASTSGGHIYTDFPVTVSGRISDSALSGIVNGGGPAVVLRTSGGNIEIMKNH